MNIKTNCDNDELKLKKMKKAKRYNWEVRFKKMNKQINKVFNGK